MSSFSFFILLLLSFFFCFSIMECNESLRNTRCEQEKNICIFLEDKVSAFGRPWILKPELAYSSRGKGNTFTQYLSLYGSDGFSFICCRKEVREEERRVERILLLLIMSIDYIYIYTQTFINAHMCYIHTDWAAVSYWVLHAMLSLFFLS